MIINVCCSLAIIIQISDSIQLQEYQAKLWTRSLSRIIGACHLSSIEDCQCLHSWNEIQGAIAVYHSKWSSIFINTNHQIEVLLLHSPYKRGRPAWNVLKILPIQHNSLGSCGMAKGRRCSNLQAERHKFLNVEEQYEMNRQCVGSNELAH